MRYAPIVLFTYNRLQHTKLTIEALLKNKEAALSDLTIFSDGAKPGAEELVRNLRTYLTTVKGFKSVKVIERQTNLGLAQSIISGVSDTLKDHENIIVLEDDLVTSQNFLKYMNDALEFYKNNDKVICIHGHCLPAKKSLPETYFLKGADCWGWATWKRGWELFEVDGKKLRDQIYLKGIQKEFDFNGCYPFLKMLNDQIEGRTNSWAIRWYASAFLNNKFTLYPGKSLVQNIGFDGQGTNCDIDGNFEVQLEQSEINIKNIPIEENAYVHAIIEEFYKSISPSLIKRVLNRIKTIWRGL